jgi:SAM-dependent methyltransferase
MNKWPKQLPSLTEEQQRISEEFMNAHLHALRTRWYGFVEKFNHTYPLRSYRPGCRTLEIGAGIGAHIPYEDIANQEYHANELLPELCRQIEERFPEVIVTPGDCQEHLPYDDALFDRVIAIHVLEHLPNLPAALREIRRVIKAGGGGSGLFSVVIPCEGGWATTMARNISARPHFEKRYKQPYDWFIKSQHINTPSEIICELEKCFYVVHRTWYPCRIPSVHCNLFTGLTLRPNQGA